MWCAHVDSSADMARIPLAPRNFDKTESQIWTELPFYHPGHFQTGQLKLSKLTWLPVGGGNYVLDICPGGRDAIDVESQSIFQFFFIGPLVTCRVPQDID